jgi:putative flippase GtrA
VRGVLKQFLSFGLVGLVNTAIGFGVIALAQVVFGLHPVPANMLGYAAGLTNSYLMNRAFTFRGAAHSGAAMLRFGLAFVLSYGVNLAVLLSGLRLLPEAALLWQGLAMVSYTIVFFALSRLYVFRSPT